MRKFLFALVCLLGTAWAQTSPSARGPIFATSSDCSTADSCITIKGLQDSGAVGISVVGTFTATLQFEQSVDGSTWTALLVSPSIQGTNVTSATAAGTWVASIGGMAQVRVRASAYTSGSAEIVLKGSYAPVGRNVFASTAGAQSVAVGMTGADGVANATGGGVANTSGSAMALSIYQYLFNSATWDRAFYCPNTKPFSVANTMTEQVAASGSTKIRICSFVLSGNATAGTMDIVYGTGTNCATGGTSLTGTLNVLGATAAPVSFNGGPSGALITPASQAICVRGTTTTVTGFFTYAQY